jgi:hypothetical protein
VTSRDSHGSGISRRSVLAALGTGVALAALAGCENPSQSVADLPDPFSPIPFNRSGAADTETAPPTPTKPLAPPVTTREPTNYGIIPRSAWAKAGPNTQTINAMGGVRLITFHHSGDPRPFTSDDYAETAQHLEYVREYHRSRKFQDIGYHFAIDRVGRVWQLRSLAYQGEHVRNNNEHNIGIVVLGNFDLQPLTSAQKEKARSFGMLVRKQYSLPISRVYTHQEIVSTECPGTGMQPYMVQVRRQGLI